MQDSEMKDDIMKPRGVAVAESDAHPAFLPWLGRSGCAAGCSFPVHLDSNKVNH